MPGSEEHTRFLKYLGGNEPQAGERRITVPEGRLKNRIKAEQPENIYWATKQIEWADQDEFIVASFDQVELRESEYEYKPALPPGTAPKWKEESLHIRPSTKVKLVEDFLDRLIQKEKQAYFLFNSSLDEYYFVSESQIQQIDKEVWDPSDDNIIRLKSGFGEIASQLETAEADTGSETEQTIHNQKTTTSKESLQVTYEGPKVLPDKSSVDRHLTKYIENRSPDSVHLLEYSSGNAQKVIDTALNHECTVYLLLRHPSREIRWRISRSQSKRVKDATTDLIDEYIDKIVEDHKDCSLYIQFYYHPAGLRARRIDNRLLNVGWYTFENRDSEGKKPRKLHVHGHDNPMILLSGQDDSYSSVNEMFRKSFYALWKQGTSLEQIYNQGHWNELHDWVELRKKREEMIPKVSEVNADALFSFDPWMNKVKGVEADYFFPEWRSE